MGLEMNINDFTDEQIRPVAFQIYQRRKQLGQNQFGSEYSDWYQAINTLQHEKEFRKNWTRGCCGQ